MLPWMLLLVLAIVVAVYATLALTAPFRGELSAFRGYGHAENVFVPTRLRPRWNSIWVGWKPWGDRMHVANQNWRQPVRHQQRQPARQQRQPTHQQRR